MKKNIHIPDEQKLRDKLQDYQPAFDEDAWNLLQQQLASPSTGSVQETIHPLNTTSQGAWHVYAPYFTITQLYYAMFVLLISLTLSGQPGRTTPPPSIFVRNEAVTDAAFVAEKHTPASIVSTPENEHFAAHHPDSNVPLTQKEEISKPSYAYRMSAKKEAETSSGDATGPDVQRDHSEPFVEETTAISQTVKGQEVGSQYPDILDDKTLNTALITEKLTKSGIATPDIMPLPDYRMLHHRVLPSDSVHPLHIPYKAAKHFDIGVSVLRGFNNGLLVRADFMRMFFPQFGIGATLTVAQYDQFNSYPNAPNYFREYYINSTGVDLTMLYNWHPFNRISFQAFGGIGFRSHLVGQVDYDTSNPVNNRMYIPGRTGKVGLDMGSNLLFHVNRHLQAGVQYVFYKDYLDDIPHRHFGGVALRMKF
jgi:hypothetical protein